jgi:hypothetical protein
MRFDQKHLQHEGWAVGEIKDIHLVTLETGKMPTYINYRTGKWESR